MVVRLEQLKHGMPVPEGESHFNEGANNEWQGYEYPVPDDEQDHSLYVRRVWYPDEDGPTCVEVRPGHRRFEASLRWDGCVDYRRYYNDREDDVDYIHICDLERLIADLMRLRDAARTIYGDDWG